MSNNKTTIVINRNGMGVGPHELTSVLVKNYLGLVAESAPLPSYICLYAEGVKLVLADSPVIEELRYLESKGVTILICKTCLNYFNVLEEVKVGTVATMVDIMGAQTNCDKVIVL